MPQPHGPFTIIGEPIPGNSRYSPVRAHVGLRAKYNTDASPYQIANEWICTYIGRFLGLPVPPAAIITTPKHPSTRVMFASLDFSAGGSDLPPINARECFRRNPDSCTGILLFDILIANNDRHDENLALDPSKEDGSLLVFDQGNALMGSERGKACERLGVMRDRLGVSAKGESGGNRHCFLDCVSTREHFEKWASRIALLPRYLFEDAAHQVENCGASSDDLNAAVDFLDHRSRYINEIVVRYRDEFRNVEELGLE